MQGTEGLTAGIQATGLLLRVLNLETACPLRSPDLLVEVPFNAENKVRLCVQTVLHFIRHDIRQLAVQVCQVSPDGRWVKAAKAVPFRDFRRLVVDQWVFNRVRRGGLTSFFQPIVRIREGHPPRIIGHEMLVRCQMQPDFLLGAGDLFRLAYNQRLRRELNTAALWCSLRGTAGHDPRQQLFVNVDPIPGESRDAFWTSVGNLLGEIGYPAGNLTFEIVESGQARDIVAVLDFAREARQRGFRIAIDDFGSQRDPYSLLFRLRPDCIKLEAGLVLGSRQDFWKKAVTENIVRMCGQLQIPCVLEGIENQLLFDWASGLGVPLMQGHYFGRPAAEPLRVLKPAGNRVPQPHFGKARPAAPGFQTGCPSLQVPLHAP